MSSPRAPRSKTTVVTYGRCITNMSSNLRPESLLIIDTIPFECGRSRFTSCRDFTRVSSFHGWGEIVELTQNPLDHVSYKEKNVQANRRAYFDLPVTHMLETVPRYARVALPGRGANCESTLIAQQLGRGNVLACPVRVRQHVGAHSSINEHLCPWSFS